MTATMTRIEIELAEINAKAAQFLPTAIDAREQTERQRDDIINAAASQLFALAKNEYAWQIEARGMSAMGAGDEVDNAFERQGEWIADATRNLFRAWLLEQ